MVYFAVTCSQLMLRSILVSVPCCSDTLAGWQLLVIEYTSIQAGNCCLSVAVLEGNTCVQGLAKPVS